MRKQVLEIEVPDGKKAIWKDGRIIFDDEDSMENIKSIEDAVQFIISKEICKDIISSLSKLPTDSYEWKIAAYRAVVAAVTYNEQRHLTTGERWYPTIEFCLSGKIENCCGNTIVGHIESEGKEFDVVGGNANAGLRDGLGAFYSRCGYMSYDNAQVGFRSVGSKKAAMYISKQFGKLLFEVIYGGTNCNWKWID
jgi:hypothetical protein